MSKNTNIADLINYVSIDGSGNLILTTGGQVATQSYVTTAISNLVNAAPTTLDTLKELATALGNDANFATTVTNSIATKLPLAGGTLTGQLSGTNARFFGNQLYYSEISADASGGFIQAYNNSTLKYYPYLIYGGSNSSTFSLLTINNNGATFSSSITATSGSFTSDINTNTKLQLGAWDAIKWTGNTLQIGGVNASQWTGFEVYTSGSSRIQVSSTGVTNFSNSVTIGNFNGESIKIQTSTPTGGAYMRFYNSTGGGEGYLGLFNNAGTNYMLLDSSTRDLNLNAGTSVYLQIGGATKIAVKNDGTLGFNGSSSPNNAGIDKLSIGFLDGNYAWIQSFNSKHLALNPLGNGVSIGTASASVYKLNVAGGIRANRSVYNWYSGAWQGNGTYWHIKTSLWGGGSPNGNIAYTMSFFKGYSYSYSGSILEGAVGFHNFSGTIYSYKTTGNIFSNVYVSSDGYVVIVVPSGQGETGITIDWHQHWDYPFIEAVPVAAGLHGTTSGKY